VEFTFSLHVSLLQSQSASSSSGIPQQGIEHSRWSTVCGCFWKHPAHNHTHHSGAELRSARGRRLLPEQFWRRSHCTHHILQQLGFKRPGVVIVFCNGWHLQQCRGGGPGCQPRPKQGTDRGDHFSHTLCSWFLPPKLPGRQWLIPCFRQHHTARQRPLAGTPPSSGRQQALDCFTVATARQSAAECCRAPSLCPAELQQCWPARQPARGGGEGRYRICGAGWVYRLVWHCWEEVCWVWTGGLAAWITYDTNKPHVLTLSAPLHTHPTALPLSENQVPYSSTASLSLTAPKYTALLIPTLRGTPTPLFADWDLGDTLAVSASALLPTGAGTVAVDPVTGDVTFIPKKDFVSAITFTLQAQDTSGGLSGAVLTQIVVGEWAMALWREGRAAVVLATAHTCNAAHDYRPWWHPTMFLIPSLPLRTTANNRNTNRPERSTPVIANTPKRHPARRWLHNRRPSGAGCQAGGHSGSAQSLHHLQYAAVWCGRRAVWRQGGGDGLERIWLSRLVECAQVLQLHSAPIDCQQRTAWVQLSHLPPLLCLLAWSCERWQVQLRRQLLRAAHCGAQHQHKQVPAQQLVRASAPCCHQLQRHQVLRPASAHPIPIYCLGAADVPIAAWGFLLLLYLRGVTFWPIYIHHCITTVHPTLMLCMSPCSHNKPTPHACCQICGTDHYSCIAPVTLMRLVLRRWSK